MADDRVERKLAAILAADMVGYSRLLEVDEVGTFTRQKSYRSELIDPTIATCKTPRFTAPTAARMSPWPVRKMMGSVLPRLFNSS